MKRKRKAYAKMISPRGGVYYDEFTRAVERAVHAEGFGVNIHRLEDHLGMMFAVGVDHCVRVGVQT